MDENVSKYNLIKKYEKQNKNKTLMRFKIITKYVNNLDTGKVICINLSQTYILFSTNIPQT